MVNVYARGDYLSFLRFLLCSSSSFTESLSSFHVCYVIFALKTEHWMPPIPILLVFTHAHTASPGRNIIIFCHFIATGVPGLSLLATFYVNWHINVFRSRPQMVNQINDTSKKRPNVLLLYLFQTTNCGFGRNGAWSFNSTKSISINSRG